MKPDPKGLKAAFDRGVRKARAERFTETSRCPGGLCGLSVDPQPDGTARLALFFEPGSKSRQAMLKAAKAEGIAPEKWLHRALKAGIEEAHAKRVARAAEEKPKLPAPNGYLWHIPSWIAEELIARAERAAVSPDLLATRFLCQGLERMQGGLIPVAAAGQQPRPPGSVTEVDCGIRKGSPLHKAMAKLAKRSGLTLEQYILRTFEAEVTERLGKGPATLAVPAEAAKLITEAAAVVGITPEQFLAAWIPEHVSTLTPDDPWGELAAWVHGTVDGVDFATAAEQKTALRRYVARLRSAGVSEAIIRQRIRPPLAGKREIDTAVAMIMPEQTPAA